MSDRDLTPITLTMTHDEALVFESWLRWIDAQPPGALFRDQAEQRAMWNVMNLFEQVIYEPFRQDYAELLAGARDRLRDPVE
jgi:hypothetical protein